MSADLLPSSSTTPLEIDLVNSLSRHGTISIDLEKARSAKFAARPAGHLPWIAIEYGLGEISQYFTDKNTLLDDGILWSRKKGTPKAVKDGLSWIGYGAVVINDSYSSRRMWHRYQIKMGLVPSAATEISTLSSAEHIAGLSDAKRSIFRRGFEGYDVRALEWGEGAWGETIWGADSGVRLPDGTVKWSHGRDYSVSMTLTSSTSAELSVNVANGDTIGWDNIPWDTPGITWNGVADSKAYKAFLMTRISAYLGFFDAGDQPIGYRRIFGAKDVTADNPPLANTAYVEYRARTGFGDGAGQVAAKVALLFHSRPTDHQKPGKQWLEPGEVEFDPSFNAANLQAGMIALPISFQRTVRENITLTVKV